MLLSVSPLPKGEALKAALLSLSSILTREVPGCTYPALFLTGSCIKGNDTSEDLPSAEESEEPLRCPLGHERAL